MKFLVFSGYQVEDAQAAMLLYKRHQAEWETFVRKQESGQIAKERKEKKVARIATLEEQGGQAAVQIDYGKRKKWNVQFQGRK